MTATRFFSDNAAAVHPAVMDALAAANHVDTAYDGDGLSRSLDGAFSDLFETPCEVVWIPTGTAANSIILAHFVLPWQRSEERRVGKEGVSTCRSRWARYN